MKNINYIGLLFLLFSTTTFAQQTEVKKDSIKLDIQLFPVHKQPAKMDIDGFILPDMNVSPSFKHGSRVDFGFSGSAAYRINDFLRFRVYGEYSVNGENNAAQGYMTPMYPQSNYGAILEIRLNDNVEIHGGVERSYDPMKGKWETYPVLYPVIYLKKRK